MVADMDRKEGGPESELLSAMSRLRLPSVEKLREAQKSSNDKERRDIAKKGQEDKHIADAVDDHFFEVPSLFY